MSSSNTPGKLMNFIGYIYEEDEEITSAETPMDHSEAPQCLLSNVKGLIEQAVKTSKQKGNRGAKRMTNVKKMSVAEFRRLGYLQELNRRFLHPLGLSLEVEVDVDNCQERLSGICDYREDPEGIAYGIGQSSKPSQLEEHIRKKEFVDDELEIRSDARKKALGYVIEPVPYSKKKVTGDTGIMSLEEFEKSTFSEEFIREGFVEYQKIRAELANRQAARSTKREKPMTPPRYDEIYFEGREAMEEETTSTNETSPSPTPK